MKMPAIFFLASMMLFSGAAAAHDRDRDCGDRHHDRDFLRNCDVDWDADEGLLTFTNEYDDDEVIEITKEYRLTVNGESIRLDRRQKGLVKDYYRKFKRLHEMAEEIGMEGAKLGASGTKIAAVVLKNICKLLGDDAEEFEEEIEREAEKLKAEAGKLEAKADTLEEIVDDLEELHHDLKKAVPELDGLDWF